MKVRIHIGHEEYDAGNGDFEQNVNIFTYRDSIINVLNNFQPTACSTLMKNSEEQDYVHTNIYHYKIEFTTAFVDSKGSYDEQHGFVTAYLDDIIINPQIVYTLNRTFDPTFDLTFN